MVKHKNAHRNDIYECNFGYFYTIKATQFIIVYICEKTLFSEAGYIFTVG